MSEGTVNSQIVDSVASAVTLTGAQAPAQAFAMLDTVMIETLGMAMYNAVSRQQGASMIGSAAVTAACAKMLGTPFGGAHPPAPPPPAPDPVPAGVRPLAPTPPSPAEIIARASVDAEDAVSRMRDEEDAAEANVATVQAAMAQLAAQAMASAHPAPPAPVPPAPASPAAYVPPGGTQAADPMATATATTTAMTITSQTIPVIPADVATEPPVPAALR